MPTLQYLSVVVPDVFQRVGRVAYYHVSQSDLRPKRPFEAKQYGLIVYWPRSLPWLELRLQHGDPGRDFSDTREGLIDVCKAFSADPDHVAPPQFLQTQRFQVAGVSRDAPIQLQLLIDTDHEAFRQAVIAAGAPAKGEFLQPVHVRFFEAKHLGAYFDQEGTLALILKPTRPVPGFDGFVAIDMGNTASTVACLSLSDAYHRTDSIRLVNADVPRGELVAKTEPIVSSVRVDQVKSYEPPAPGVRRFPSVPKDDYPQTINWVVGRLANPAEGIATGAAPVTHGLILGAKRLAAGKDWEGFLKLVASHRHTYLKTENSEQIELLNRLPAELLVCRLLQRFREAARAWPRQLAVTYPTTYSPRELEQLREVVQRAWLRLQSRLQTPIPGFDEPPDDNADVNSIGSRLQMLVRTRPGTLAPGDDPLNRLMIDEASAAAYFFLYRRIFESPGGLPRFRYLYPHGLNLLLIDVGGGTTDIALVWAGTDPEVADVLRVRVLARSGLRGFGGDDVTRAVCRILKAKMILKVADARGRPLKINWPTAPSSGARSSSILVEEFLNRIRDTDPRDELVPTTFNPNQLDDMTSLRRDHAFDLWRWGENLKVRLETNDSVPFMRIDRNLNRLSATMLRGLSDTQTQQLVTQLERVTISRWEVDALVDAPVNRCVRNCNQLIRDVLTSGRDGRENEEVQWVVVSGNGSRYPMIREALGRGLHVPFLDEGRMTYDQANLKHAVAKGAVLALATISAIGTVRVAFDSDLSECLPFDIAHKDQKSNTYPILYREHTRYDRIESKMVPLVALRQGLDAAHPLETFVLDRRFPGDAEFSPYLAFHFADGIRGDLEVSYDPHSREFAVRDMVANVFGELRDVTDTTLYRSPAQRGDL